MAWHGPLHFSADAALHCAQPKTPASPRGVPPPLGPYPSQVQVSALDTVKLGCGRVINPFGGGDAGRRPTNQRKRGPGAAPTRPFLVPCLACTLFGT